MMIFILIAFFVLAFLLGFAIAYLARDEIVAGRKWFIALMVLSLGLGIYFLFIGNYPISLSLAFIIIVSLVSFVKSKDKKFTGKKFK